MSKKWLQSNAHLKQIIACAPSHLCAGKRRIPLEACAAGKLHPHTPPGIHTSIYVWLSIHIDHFTYLQIGDNLTPVDPPIPNPLSIVLGSAAVLFTIGLAGIDANDFLNDGAGVIHNLYDWRKAWGLHAFGGHPMTDCMT